MDIMMLLSQQIVAMFLMLLVGFFCVRFKVMRTEDARPISTAVLYVISPCTILHVFQVQLNPEAIRGLGIGVVLVLAAHVPLIGLPMLLRKPLRLNAVEQMTISYPNSGNLILPIVINVLGQQWAIFAMPFLVVQMVFMWTHGISTMNGDRTVRLRTLLTGVNMVAIYIGLALMLLQISLPAIVRTTLSGFSSCIAPLSMLVIGMTIGNEKILRVFQIPRHYLVSFMRLVLMPLLVMGLLYVTGIPRQSVILANVSLILVLAVSSSQAATVSQLAQVFHRNEREAAMLNVMTVLLLVVTMPMNAWIMTRLFS